MPNREVKGVGFNVKNLESVHRITNIPIVETSWSYAGNIYTKVKLSNTLFSWTLQQAEFTFQTAIDSALPIIGLFEGPISSVDKLVCKSLDAVERNVPSISLPPEMIYWNTKQYAKQYVTDMSSKIVKPVLQRADSVKHIGNTVLTSKYTEFAADTLDGALNVADKYVDKYLPAAVYDDERAIRAENNVNAASGPGGKARNTINHMGRISGKLQRRLTKMTLTEAKALKTQGVEAINVLLYAAELIATDPKLALAKGKELWASLSKDEPENQARPENLEQLIVLLTRESARQVVHLINFTGSVLGKVPRHISHTVIVAVSKFLHIVDSSMKRVHLENVEQVIVQITKTQAHYCTILLKQLNLYISELLDNVAKSLSDENFVEKNKTVLEVPKVKVQLRAVHKNKNANGVENKKDN